MSLNIVRSGTSAVVGIASGALSTQPGISIGASLPAISPSAIAEAVALVVGAAAQFLSPATMPNFVDGLVDGGVALLARRGAMHLMLQTSGSTATITPAGGYRMNGAMYGGVHQASAAGLAGGNGMRPQMSTVGHLPEQRLS